jgi:hypothetical protein
MQAGSQSEGLGSELVLEGDVAASQRGTATKRTSLEGREKISIEMSGTEKHNLQNLLAASIKESNTALQTSVEQKIKSSRKWRQIAG